MYHYSYSKISQLNGSQDLFLSAEEG